MSLSVSPLKVICFQSDCSLNVARLFPSQRLYTAGSFFFLCAHRCDSNVPRCLFSVLHRCHVGVLSVRKHAGEEDAARAAASPGLASPSLKLTTPAPSAAPRSLETVQARVVCEPVRVYMNAYESMSPWI